MPFIKRGSTKRNRSWTHTRKIFIGRKEEINFFVRYILEPEEPTYNILSVSGNVGVGKSTLLDQFIAEALTSRFKDVCLIGQVDEHFTTPAAIMEKFAEQLLLMGEFEKELRQYKEALRKLQTDRTNSRDAALQKLATDLTGATIKSIPGIGGVLEREAGSVIDYVVSEFRYHRLLKDAERLEDPVGNLTKSFVKELNQLADGQKRILIFFDTFEQVASEVALWLSNDFLTDDISNSIVLVIAGRDPLERSIREDPGSWSRYQDSIYSIHLNNFTREETGIYLAARGITEAPSADLIWKRSQGLPLYLSLLTSNSQEEVDPTADVVVSLLRGIPQQEHVKRRLALDGALLSRPFNQDDLAAFSYISESDRPTFFRWLIEQPFVRRPNLQGETRYRYYDWAQELFCHHLYQRSPEECQSTRRNLANYYRTVLDKTEDEMGEEVYNSTEWMELVLALVHQLFLLPDENSHLNAIELTLNAYENSRQATDCLRILAKLSQEQPNNQISISARWTVRQVLRYITADLTSQRHELIAAASSLVQKIERKTSFPTRLLAGIYCSRGINNLFLKNYHRAAADLDRALKLDPTLIWAYGLRGLTHYSFSEAHLAIEDFTRAIELDAKSVWAYWLRYKTYTLLKEHQKAAEDAEHVLELVLGFDLPYLEKAENYSLLSTYQQFRRDFDSNFRLPSQLNLNYISPNEIDKPLNEFQRVIEHFVEWILSLEGSYAEENEINYLVSPPVMKNLDLAHKLLPTLIPSSIKENNASRSLGRLSQNEQVSTDDN